MKKFFKSLSVAAVAAVVAMSAASCGGVVKNGSKIEKCKVTLSYTADGETLTRDVNFELYTNFAPATIEHFKYLAENGYYDGTVVSNVNSYLEFGEYYSVDGNEASKYAADATNGYSKYITSAYTSGKTIGGSGLSRYTDTGAIRGEFAANGIGGNTLTLSGALVLKRDYSADKNNSYYDTGRATMAVTFGTGAYFDAANKFAVIGKILSDDNDEFSDSVSSYSFVQKLRTDYAKDADGNAYYYYSYESDDEDNAAKIEKYGRYFMTDEDGAYYAKDSSGAYTVELDEEEDADLIKEFASKSVYMRTIPYSTITVVSVKVG